MKRFFSTPSRNILPANPSRSFSRILADTRRSASVALIIAIVIAGVSFTNLFSMRRSAHWVEHTHEVLTGFERLLAHVKNLQIGRQMYALSGDSVRLNRYLQSGPRIDSDLVVLRVLTRDNPTQTRRIELLTGVITRDLRPLAPLPAVRAHSGTPFLAIPDSSLQAVTAIRAIIRDAVLEEQGLLRQRARQQEFDIWATFLIMAIGFVAAMTLVGWSNAQMLKTIRAHERAENEAVRALEQAEAANRSKSDFLARMSHELRTPLNSVIGFANVLLKNRGGHLVQSDLTYLDRIQANGQHLLSLINQILDLAKIESGRIDLMIEAVDVGTLVKEIVAQFETLANERSVEIRAVVPERLQPVHTDAEKLRQILINLVGNALKFTEMGSVSVVVTAKQGIVGNIAVCDTGIGIPADRLGAVFEAFEQAETTTSRRFGGTGLGLSISHSLAQLMGLELTVESKVGVGTTFTLLFPSKAATLTPSRGGALYRTDTHPTTTHPTSADVAALRDRLVLVIDDDPDSRVLMAQYLEDIGCRVIAATNGEQGLRMANNFTPDAILLDLRMPGIDGWEVLRRLRADPGLQETPTIVVSVIARESREEAVGAVALIDKPCTKDELAAALATVLKGQA